MKELSVMEMNEVSGAYSWNFSSWTNAIGSIASNIGEVVASTALASTAAGWTGAIIGGKHGGDGGGLLGFGAIGQGVGMLAGGLFGMAGGAIAGAIVGWELSLEYSKKALDGIINGTL